MSFSSGLKNAWTKLSGAFAENVKVWLNVNFRVYIIDGVEVKDHSSSDSSRHQKILYMCMAFPIGFPCFWINHSTKSNIKYINKTLLVHTSYTHKTYFYMLFSIFSPTGVIKACGNFREIKASFISSQTELSAPEILFMNVNISLIWFCFRFWSVCHNGVLLKRGN